jgi:predicted nucleotide-binding protein (sugar kinase/HSP70/actin superfamily)
VNLLKSHLSDPAILKKIKKGATIEQARDFMKHCRSLGFKVLISPPTNKEIVEQGVKFADDRNFVFP